MEWIFLLCGIAFGVMTTLTVLYISSKGVIHVLIDGEDRHAYINLMFDKKEDANEIMFSHKKYTLFRIEREFERGE